VEDEVDEVVIAVQAKRKHSIIQLELMKKLMVLLN
jgi:hypothetical protein